jgi:hypothetical protein
MGAYPLLIWIDRCRTLLLAAALGLPLYVIGMLYLWNAPETTRIGYAPEQPVPFSHALHAGELGLDCRYCHTTVETAAFAAIPPTETCMNCHSLIGKDDATQSSLLAPVYNSARSQPAQSIEWVKVHNLPDYVYFDHSAHVTRGVSCVSCHGRVDQMDVVTQVEPLTMAWCLDCHRNPDPHLRPAELATDLDWEPGEDRAVLGARVREENNINPSTDCSTCHR